MNGAQDLGRFAIATAPSGRDRDEPEGHDAPERPAEPGPARFWK